ncbi:MAG: SDR family oxidoreductase [Archangiaceae bacterium]|nr:SDR family oxidoreductase [Archangiaceae bacterium]
MRFDGRTVVVTGASRGLGRAMAQAFAAEGAFVYIGFLRAEAEAAETVKLCGANARALRFDVTRADEVERAFTQVHEARGRVDVLVNNAGCSRDAPAMLVDPAEWREVLAVNLDGAMGCTRAVLARMLHARKGAIVNVASATAVRANPGQAAYAASKGGLLALTRTLAAELSPKGIRVNAVLPGVIDAGMVKRMDRRALEKLESHVPLGRLGQADEVARAVLFLASDEASYIVGAELPVDGGLLL